MFHFFSIFFFSSNKLILSRTTWYWLLSLSLSLIYFNTRYPSLSLSLTRTEKISSNELVQLIKSVLSMDTRDVNSVPGWKSEKERGAERNLSHCCESLPASEIDLLDSHDRSNTMLQCRRITHFKQPFSVW